MDARVPVGYSVCPHDCPSACALEVDLLEGGRIGRVRGSGANTYTAGVICAKVANYAERAHHPDRLLYPLKRKGPKGSGQFERISWEDALDLTAEKFLEAERLHGAEAVWPYYYAGTMGLVMRDGINRLRHAKRYSDMYATFCTTLAWPGFIAGTGKLAGVDPREMAKSDLVVIWGTNPVNTQVNVMTHAIRARKERGARIAVIDIYNTGTMQQADIGLVLRPGTDGALACAIMHVLFRDGYSNRAYMQRYTAGAAELEAHLKDKTPEWAAAITGLSVAEIESFARAIGTTPRTFFRLGYGFSRQRNGAVNMHAALSIPAVTGAWEHEGGGAFHNNGAIFKWNKTLIEGLDVRDESVRVLDQSRIGDVLTGNPLDLKGGPPVTALLVQSTNPVQVAPEQAKVKAGFARDDLFTVVHEHFMTATARMADVVLPATQFIEHDDIYQGGGHQHIMLGLRLVPAPGECRSNHELICDLAKRVGARHRGFEMTAREMIDETLRVSGWGGIDELEAAKFRDVQPDFRAAHYLDGFAHTDKRYHFQVDWPKVPAPRTVNWGAAHLPPSLPEHWPVNEGTDERHPFRLATSPSRGYLNSSFNEMPSSRKREGKPRAKINPADMARLGIGDGDRIRMGNTRGEITLTAERFEGVQTGVVIVESIAPNDDFEGGAGINTLTSAHQCAPFGGTAYHDNAVWIRPAA